MTQPSDNAVLYSAVYDDVSAARADLDAFEQLHKAQMIGKYDAAIIDQEYGQPHIVKRIDHPAVRVIPEWFGSGPLPRRELHDVARGLDQREAALIVVGEPTLEQGWDRAVTHTVRAMKHDLNATLDELSRDLTGASSR